MKALILAAGRGTRVRPLTDQLPKPMIPIINKPVMEFLVEHLQRFGITQSMVNTSYLSPQIERYFGDGRRFGVDIAYLCIRSQSASIYSHQRTLRYRQPAISPPCAAGKSLWAEIPHTLAMAGHRPGAGFP
jgi:CTP:phosphocholine cytidylyltransferase-like protein